MAASDYGSVGTIDSGPGGRGGGPAFEERVGGRERVVEEKGGVGELVGEDAWEGVLG